MAEWEFRMPSEDDLDRAEDIRTRSAHMADEAFAFDVFAQAIAAFKERSQRPSITIDVKGVPELQEELTKFKMAIELAYTERDAARKELSSSVAGPMNRISNLEVRLGNALRTSMNHQGMCERLTKELGVMEGDRDEAERQIGSTRSIATHLEAKCLRLQKYLKDRDEKINELELVPKIVSDATAEAVTVGMRSLALRTRIVELENELAEARRDGKKAHDLSGEWQDRAENAQHTLERVRGAANGLDEQSSSLRDDVGRLENVRDGLQGQVDQLVEQLNHWKDRAEGAEKTLLVKGAKPTTDLDVLLDKIGTVIKEFACPSCEAGMIATKNTSFPASRLGGCARRIADLAVQYNTSPENIVETASVVLRGRSMP